MLQSMVLLALEMGYVDFSYSRIESEIATFLSRFATTMEAVHVLWALLAPAVRQLMKDP